jgi:hypothetical protein
MFAAVAVNVYHGVLPQSRLFKRLLGLMCFVAFLVIEACLTGHIPDFLFTYGLTVFGLSVGVLLIQATHNPPSVLKAVLEFPLLV